MLVSVANGAVQSALHAEDLVEGHLHVAEILDDQFEVHVQEGIVQTNAVFNLLLINYDEVSVHDLLTSITLSGH